MSNNRFQFQENHFYHIYNRWFNKQKLFFDEKDYERFYQKIIKYLLEYKKSVSLISFCILPNHFHFVIRSLEKWFQVSKFMQKIQLSYAMYIKSQYKETIWRWQVFEWRFKAKLLKDENYLNQCITYVNYNPIKHKLVKNIEDYPYSSYSQIYEWKSWYIKLEEIEDRKNMNLEELTLNF